ncbi:TIR domain-containing protein [Ruminococcus sp. OM05-10BH]|nr:TIR domain-containing protein [Ruminococcus sp. OM05-10BH]
MADTNKGLKRAELVKLCNKYAIKYGVDIPVATTDWGDFGKKVKNKRTAMYQNLSVFSGEQQFNIIKEISELPIFSDNSEVKELHKFLLERYSSYSECAESITTEERNYASDAKCPIVFISYSWDDDEHKKWVKNFSDRLLSDGINAVVDQYDLSLGDRLPQFMEQSISDADFVLIICTPKYKSKADKRTGGVGYEGHIISDELFQHHNERKFIPVLRRGNFETALPKFCAGKLSIDLSDTPFSEEQYHDLLATIFGKKKKPKIGKKLSTVEKIRIEDNVEEPIHIIGIITNEVTIPKMDGSRGSALYSIPFQLSRTPSRLWCQLFIDSWNMPPSFSTMHRPGIAKVVDSKIVLNGTTIDEVKKYHRDTLMLCVEEANKQEAAIKAKERKLKEQEEQRKQQHYQHIIELADEISF